MQSEKQIKRIHWKRSYTKDSGQMGFIIGCKIENQTYCYAWSYDRDQVTCKKCLKNIKPLLINVGVEANTLVLTKK